MFVINNPSKILVGCFGRLYGRLDVNTLLEIHITNADFYGSICIFLTVDCNRFVSAELTVSITCKTLGNADSYIFNRNTCFNFFCCNI